MQNPGNFQHNQTHFATSTRAHIFKRNGANNCQRWAPSDSKGSLTHKQGASHQVVTTQNMNASNNATDHRAVEQGDEMDINVRSCSARHAVVRPCS